MEYFKAFNSLLFPSRDLCYFCKERSKQVDRFICEACRGRLEILDREILLDSPYIEKAYYSAMYNKFMRKMVQEFKFHGKSFLYKPLGEIMLKTLDKIDIGPDLIIYVASHRRKEAIRGYNQSELLARYISEATNIPLSSGNLIKVKHTRDQNKLDRLQRKNNLLSSFKVRDKREIEGKLVLLIDDIITTGSTMIECSKVVMESGARKILGLALTSSHRI